MHISLKTYGVMEVKLHAFFTSAGGQLHNQDSLQREKPPLHWYSPERGLGEPQRGSFWLIKHHVMKTCFEKV
jgi:hypothetical protein